MSDNKNTKTNKQKQNKQNKTKAKKQKTQPTKENQWMSKTTRGVCVCGGACGQTCRPEFDSWNSHAGKKEPTSQIVL